MCKTHLRSDGPCLGKGIIPAFLAIVYQKREFFRKNILRTHFQDYGLDGDIGIIPFYQKLLRWDWMLVDTPVILGTLLFYEYIGFNWVQMRA